MNEYDSLWTLKQDLENTKTPKSAFFFKHFVLHELDFLTIINKLFNNMNNANNETKIEKTESNMNSVPDYANNNNNNNNNNNSSAINNNSDQEKKSSLKTKLGGTNEMPRSYDKTLGPKWQKKIKKIVSNRNLSVETKNELIVDLIIQFNKDRELRQLQRLPSANASLLGAGKNKTPSGGSLKTNEQKTASLSQSVPRHSKKYDNQSPRIDCDGNDDNISDDDDDDEATNTPNDSNIDIDDDSNDNDDDNDDDDDDNNGDDDSNDDDIINEEDYNGDDDRDSDEDHDIGNDDRTHALQSKANLNTLPNKLAMRFILQCKTSMLPLSISTKRLLQNLATRMTKYLANRVKEGFESSDRRFVLTHDGILHYNHHITISKMSLQKVFASLTLGTAKLFRYLESTSRHNVVKRYTNSEKVLLSNLVRLANINPKFIGCVKIRKLCHP